MNETENIEWQVTGDMPKKNENRRLRDIIVENKINPLINMISEKKKIYHKMWAFENLSRKFSHT
jgi:hypothetical protein